MTGNTGKERVKKLRYRDREGERLVILAQRGLKSGYTGTERVKYQLYRDTEGD